MTSVMNSRRGVTLVELTISGLLITMIALMSWPRLRHSIGGVIETAESQRRALNERAAR